MARDWLAAKPRGARRLQRLAVPAWFVDARLCKTPLPKTRLCQGSHEAPGAASAAWDATRNGAKG